MKKSVLFLTLTAFMAGMVFTGCDRQAEKVDSAKAKLEAAEHELQKAKEDFNPEYEKFKIEAEKQIEENESLIADLKEQSTKIKREAKAQYETTIADLEKRNEAMKTKIRNYKNERDEKWEAFKREFNHDVTELGQSIKDLLKNNVE